MTTPQDESIQTGEENNNQLLSTFVHVENVNGPQFIFNCGHRSLKEMLALQEQAIKFQRQEREPNSLTTSQPPIPASSVKPTRKPRPKKQIESEEQE